MTDPVSPFQSSNDLALDLLEILRVLRKRLVFVLLIAFIFVAATAFLSLSVTPIYQATSQVLYDPTVRQPFDNPNRPTRLGQGTEVIDSQISVIMSDTVLRPVAHKNNLATDPVFNKDTGSGLFGSLAGLFSIARTDKEASQETQETAAIEKLSKATSVKRVGQTYVINISVDSPSPTQAAVLANEIAESYLEDQSRQVGNASKEVAFQIDDRLAGLRERLRQAESEIQKFRAENKLQSSKEGLLLTEQGLSGLNTQLVEARAALAEASAKNEEIQRILRSGIDAEAIGDVVNSSTVSRLREQYAFAARTEADLLADLLPSHPSVIRTRSQLERIRMLIRDEVKRVAESSQIDLKVNQERVAKLEEQIDTARTRSNVDETASIKLRELETEAQATRSLYEIALGRAKQISELDQVVIPNARIITPAIVPDSPIWPKKKIMVVLAAILGLLIGSGLAIGAEALRIAKKHLLPGGTAVSSHVAASQLLATTSTEVVTGPEFGNSALDPQTHVSMELVRKLAAEPPRKALRNLRTVCDLPQLPGSQGSGEHRAPISGIVTTVQDAIYEYHTNNGGPGWRFGRSVDHILTEIADVPTESGTHIVFFTSPALGHGQTTTALALALDAAQRNLRVLLADGEPRQRMLSRDLSLREMEAGSSLRERVVSYHELGISFLSLVSGLPKYKHHQLSIQEAYEFADIAREFDLVIIDGVALPQLTEDDPLVGFATNFLITVAEQEMQQTSFPVLSQDLLTIAEGRPAGLVRTLAGNEGSAHRKHT